ncbi:uncharacterized protein J8A68_005123 [[Candida] subhashii]|uniref:NAD-dependent epimerase/dehydratase domain-containing protein n=1 Tax=[Candida] subhashii TaxID=561895 RepID=A0A8J5QDF8_9ASCO|nr:uncharacterized protein J8A68_005123 [[Candida] subhashii]KAG7661332.1 hypothetical protein J8A68_005123 [[Candida] subhashii]
MSSTTVFVSGANGFIAQHVVKQLLTKGYSVVGTVRSATKGEWLKQLTNSNRFSFEVVSDISAEGAFDQALKRHPEATVFIHMASPVSFSVNDIENELLQPAIKGTKNALKAIHEHAPQIKRVVVTSSAVAVFHWGKTNDYEKIHTESDWNPISYQESLENSYFGYFGSKKFGELSAWEFVDEVKPNFDISFVNPSFVFGPQAFEIKDKSQLNLSAEVVNSVVKLGRQDKIPEVVGTFVDVRDVARAHIFAFESDKAINKRFLLASEKFSNEKIAYLINEKFPNSRVPKGDLDKHVRQIKKEFNVDTSKTREILGFDFLGIEQSVFDTTEQIYAAS